MSNTLFYSKEDDIMKHINPTSTLEDVEKTVDMAYEMAKYGKINSAINAIENAHSMYRNNTKPISEEESARFIVLARCHSFTIC